MAADPADQFCVAEERSGHCAVVDGNFLYVWGGYVVRRAGGHGGAGKERAPSAGSGAPGGAGGVPPPPLSPRRAPGAAARALIGCGGRAPFEWRREALRGRRGRR